MIDVAVAPQLTIIFFLIVLMQKCMIQCKMGTTCHLLVCNIFGDFYEQPKTFLMMKVLQTAWPKFIKET